MAYDPYADCGDEGSIDSDNPYDNPETPVDPYGDCGDECSIDPNDPYDNHDNPETPNDPYDNLVTSISSSGHNGNGELGVGDFDNRSSFTSMSLTSYIDIDAGEWFTAVIKDDGTLWLCGNGPEIPGGSDSAYLVQETSHAEWLMVSCGNWHSLAVQADGSLWGQGNASYGAPGIGGIGYSANYTKCLDTTGYKTNVTLIASGTHHSMVATGNGKTWGTGHNTQGPCANGVPYRSYEFSETTLTISPIALAAGSDFSAAIGGSGRIYTSGSNMYGQLGMGDWSNRNQWSLTGQETYISLSCGNSAMWAITSDGILQACGSNTFGELGLGDTDNRNELCQVGADSDWLSVFCGHWHTFALKGNGNMYFVGLNGTGQSGLGHTNNVITLTKLAGIWEKAAGGYAHSIGPLITNRIDDPYGVSEL